MNQKIHEIVLGPNQDIKKSIEKFLIEHQWESAYISGGIGSVKNIEITVPIGMELPPVIEKIQVEGPGELVSFVGEIMKREHMDPALKAIYADKTSPYFIHLHVSVGVKGGNVVGGGLQSGKTFRGVKLYLCEVL